MCIQMTLFNRYWILESLAEFVASVGVYSPLQIYPSYLVEIDLAAGKNKAGNGLQEAARQASEGAEHCLLAGLWSVKVDATLVRSDRQRQAGWLC